ncbi:MAG: EamA family transporter RarD [Acidobacteriota bacterium]
MTDRSRGVVYALLAYLSWGLGPLLWKQLLHVAPLSVLAHRIIWACLLLVILLASRRRLRELSLLRDPRQLGFLALSAALLAVNWFTYIFAVASGNILQASLGYFINPLVNIVFGMLFLKERLRLAQWIAVLLAACAIAIQMQGAGVPWLSLLLAFTFAVYGLMRKVAKADGLLGTTVETQLMLIPALLFLVFGATPSENTDPHGPAITVLLLVLGGVQTALPLLWFTNAARLLPLSTLGFFQYLAPTCQFLLAIAVYGESFGRVEMLSFGLIWAGLILVTVTSGAGRKRREPQPASA